MALCCEAQRCLHRVWRAGRTHSIVSRTESTSTDADKVETQTRYNQQPSEIVGCRSCGVGLAFLCRTTIFFRRRTTHGRSRRASHGSTSYITCDKSLIKATAQQRSSSSYYEDACAVCRTGWCERCLPCCEPRISWSRTGGISSTRFSSTRTWSLEAIESNPFPPLDSRKESIG